MLVALLRSHVCKQVALKLPEGNVSDADLSEMLLKRKLKTSSGVGWHVAEVTILRFVCFVSVTCLQTASDSSLI